MQQVKVVETNLNFAGLAERLGTNLIVIHHTGNPADDDLSAEEIHRSHLAQGYVGIGYHFVIRKNGRIERGRPLWAVGSHAYGFNRESVGIHICGNFELAVPTSEQIESAALLIANLSVKFDLPIDNKRVLGHRDLMATACPGQNLYLRLDELRGKANWYRYNQPNAIDLPVVTGNIFALAQKYESNDNPAAIGARGEKLFYGSYQFDANTTKEFVDWLKSYPDSAFRNYGRLLAEQEIGSAFFVQNWKQLGTLDPGHCGELQAEFAKIKYYDKTFYKLAEMNFHLEKHSTALQAVVFARAIQHGVGGCLRLLNLVCKHPNLSYIDDRYFDADFISDIYDFLIAECDSVNILTNRSINNFVGGDISTVNALRKRFVSERSDALRFLTGSC